MSELPAWLDAWLTDLPTIVPVLALGYLDTLI